MAKKHGRSGRPRKKIEDSFQAQIIVLAKHYGWRVYHNAKVRSVRSDGSVRWLTSTHGHTGFTDLVLAKDGVVLHVELKTPIGKLSAEQKLWRDAMGDSWRLWRPEDWPEITAILSDGRAKSTGISLRK